MKEPCILKLVLFFQLYQLIRENNFFTILASLIFSEHLTYSNINGVLLLGNNVYKSSWFWTCVPKHYFLFEPCL